MDGERRTRLPDGKIWSLPFLGLRRGGGRGAHSKERKGSNFAAQRSGAIVQKPEGPNTYDSKNPAIAIWQPWQRARPLDSQTDRHATDLLLLLPLSRRRPSKSKWSESGFRPKLCRYTADQMLWQLEIATNKFYYRDCFSLSVVRFWRWCFGKFYWLIGWYCS